MVRKELPLGSRSLIVGGLHLPVEPTPMSRAVADRLADAVDALVGPGAVVLAGDVFELAEAIAPDCGPALATHCRLTAALERYASEAGRSVTVLLGGRERALAQDRTGRRHLDERGWTVDDLLYLDVGTSGGVERIVVEPLDGVTAEDSSTPSWLAGATHLEEPCELANWAAGRWVSQRWVWPLALLGVAGVMIAAALAIGRNGATALAGVVAAAALLSLARRVGRGAVRHFDEDEDPDEARRSLGRRIVESVSDASQRTAGWIGAGSLRPELVPLDGGRFVALSGACGPLVVRRAGRLGVATYPCVRQISWVEVEGGADLSTRLVLSRTDIADRHILPTLLRRRAPKDAALPRVVASTPSRPGAPDRFGTGHARPSSPTARVRRRAGAVVAAVAALDLVSAVTPPLSRRLHLLNDLLPSAVPRMATLMAALVGLALLVISNDLRRGRRRALIVACGLCTAAAVVHVLKGLDVEEAVISVAVAGWLIAHRSAFAVGGRRSAVEDVDDSDRARAIVATWGSDTLAYFALRADKRWYFWGDTLVAYAVHHGVCLVSPDPVGPADERVAAWRAFRCFAADHGWRVAVVGASPGWLATYSAAGMRHLYLGDEAIVDVETFSLEGTANKSLRHTINKVRKGGYRVEFFNPAIIDAALRGDLLELMTQSRRGDAERGFSMTLGRLFDTTDQGLLLAVAFDADGRPSAFCQFVPSSDIGGWSLDVMRRRSTDRTNGLLDFVVVETISHLRAGGCRGLGLNFATLRTVMSGEHGDTIPTRLERWAVGRLGDSMQIESLRRYNDKFRPRWRPRYAVIEGYDQVLGASLALARAESWWELPVIGRFLTPGRTASLRGTPPE